MWVHSGRLKVRKGYGTMENREVVRWREKTQDCERERGGREREGEGERENTARQLDMEAPMFLSAHSACMQVTQQVRHPPLPVVSPLSSILGSQLVAGALYFGAIYGSSHTNCLRKACAAISPRTLISARKFLSGLNGAFKRLVRLRSFSLIDLFRGSLNRRRGT